MSLVTGPAAEKPGKWKKTPLFSVDTGFCFSFLDLRIF